MKQLLVLVSAVALSNCMPPLPNVTAPFNQARSMMGGGDNVEDTDGGRGDVPALQQPNYDPSSYRVRMR